MLADRAMVRSLGWVQSRVLARVVTSTSSGSSDLGMHLVAPTMIRHCAGSGEMGTAEQHWLGQRGHRCSEGDFIGNRWELGGDGANGRAVPT